MKHSLLAFVALVLGVLPAPAQPSLTLEDVRDTYQSLDGMEASFTQVVGSEFAGDSTRIEGTVTLSGDRYRVETPGQTVVTDGETTWIYSPADSQVVVDDAAADEGPITPETFLDESAQQYEVTDRRTQTVAGTPHVVLSLTSTTSEARFRDASLWVRQADRLVTRLRATDLNGATFDLRLRDLQVNPSLSDSTFSFRPPGDIEVVDLREGD
jgi:outer membrane lipoprotein carrier protein